MATNRLFKITKSVCENDYTRFARYNRKDCDECVTSYVNPKKIRYVLHVEKKK